MITVPAAFIESTVAREGHSGEAWLHALPDLVRALCDEWRLAVDGAAMHGYVAVVVPVVRDGEGLVLKVSWVDQSSRQEALALRAWAGDGAVRLLDAREDVGALLLERLDPARTLQDVAEGRAVTTSGVLLRRLAVPAPAGLRTVALEMADLRAGLTAQWERVGRPFPRALLDRTLDLAGAADDPGARCIVNQDLHYGNVLAGEREPWLVIDPKPLAGAPEFGVAQLLWTRFEDLAGRAGLERRLAMLVEAAELDAPRARAWSTVRLVDNWLWSLGQGFADDVARCRTLLDWLRGGP